MFKLWTMSASAISIFNWNAIGFCRHRSNHFQSDLEKLKKKLTKNKRIMAADIFGKSEDIDKIKNYKNKNIKIISDAAQSPYALYKNKSWHLR